MSKDAVLNSRIRAAEWHGVGQRLRDSAVCENTEINDWCMDQAKVCWARGDEAYAIAKVLEKEAEE